VEPKNFVIGYIREFAKTEEVDLQEHCVKEESLSYAIQSPIDESNVTQVFSWESITYRAYNLRRNTAKGGHGVATVDCLVANHTMSAA
jgi:hypothetical protein